MRKEQEDEDEARVIGSLRGLYRWKSHTLGSVRQMKAIFEVKKM